MPFYEYKCVNKKCEAFNKEKLYEMSVKEYEDTLAIYCDVCGEPMSRSYSSFPGVILKGLGFYKTDKEYEDQLKLAEAIADKMYERRAANSVAKDKISEDDSFWQELASQDFAKEVKRRDYFTPRNPTTILGVNEEKTSTTVAKASKFDWEKFKAEARERSQRKKKDEE